MENRYKNIKITRQTSLNLDSQTSNICNLNKTPAKPTCNIETKTNDTSFVAHPNSRA